MVDHPDWTRPCASCETHHLAGGRLSPRAELPLPLQTPPCRACPKIPAGAPGCPASGRDLDAPAWADVLRWYFRGKAVGFSHGEGEGVPDDLADLAAVIDGFIDSRGRREARLRAEKKPVPRPAEAVLRWVAFGG